MWDLILAVFLTAHVLAGIVAAFVAFPVAALAAKGGTLHRWAGRSFVGCRSASPSAASSHRAEDVRSEGRGEPT